MNLQELTKIPDRDRDQKWEDQFLQAFADSKVKVLSPDPQEGPDGWPYMMVETEGNEPAQKVMLWLAGRGIGLVINPTKDYPILFCHTGCCGHFAKPEDLFIVSKFQSVRPHSRAPKKWN